MPCSLGAPAPELLNQLRIFFLRSPRTGPIAAQSASSLEGKSTNKIPGIMASTTVSTTTTSSQPITAETILRLFPDIDTSGDALEGHDEEQIRLMDEMCIVTDENDIPIGKASKKICKHAPARARCGW